MRYAEGAEDRLIEAAEEKIQRITVGQSEAQPTWDGAAWPLCHRLLLVWVPWGGHTWAETVHVFCGEL
jgi:hypothetical protein